MKKHTISRLFRAGCLILAAAVAFSLPAAAAASGASTKKDETVYVSLDSSGAVKSTTVSDWLHADGSPAGIADRSDLSDIRNVKSDAQPVRNGGSLVWPTGGSDGSGANIYYEGKTDKSLPLKISVAYTLNGKAAAANEIAGKSGKIGIHVSLKNTSAQTVEIGGSDTTMYTPMTAVVAVTLPSDTFRNVTVSSGKIISDGNNQFVTFLAMPGLEESLDLKDCGIDGLSDIDLPENLEITADADDFTLGPIAVAATPELMDEKDLNSADSSAKMKSELNKLSDMQNNMEKADPNKDIRSLFTNPDRTAAARLLIDDVFGFYALDTKAIDILPDYVNNRNITLYDRVTSDLDKADLTYLLDNKIIRGLNSRLTDDNIGKAKTLLGDYDDLETFDMSRLDGAMKVMNHYDQVYSHLDPILEDTRKIMNGLDSDDLDTLSALSSSGVRDSLSDTLASMKQLSDSGLLSSSFQLSDANVKALMTSVLSDHPDLMENALQTQMEALEDKNGNISVSDLLNLLNSAGLSGEQISAISAQAEEAVLQNPSSKAVIPESELPSELQQMMGGLGTQAAALSDGNGNLYLVKLLPLIPANDTGSTLMDALMPSVRIPVEELEPLMENLMQDDSVKSALLSTLDVSELREELNGLLRNSADLNDSLTKSLGKNYSDKISDALSTLGSVRSVFSDLQDNISDLEDSDESGRLSDDLDDAEDLLLNKENMDYLISWGNKLKSMKGDLDGNTENVSLLRDLIGLNDDPKIKAFRAMAPALQTDADDARPILESLKNRLNEPDISASFHKLPETTASLMKSEKDLNGNQAIMGILRLTMEPNTVSLFGDTFGKLDDLTAKDTTGKALSLLEKKDAYVKLSDQYKIFTEAADGAQTSLKFVFKTAEIKEPEPVKAQAVQTSASSGQASGTGLAGMWNHVRSFFSQAAGTIGRLF